MRASLNPTLLLVITIVLPGGAHAQGNNLKRTWEKHTPRAARGQGRPAHTAMPRDSPGPRRTPRTAAAVHAALAGAPEPPLPIRKIRLVLVAGEKDHGKGEHDY